jgi:hypothetical protein
VTDKEQRKGRGRPSMGERKSLLLRLPPDLTDELKSWSAQELRSLNGHIEYLLRNAINQRKGGNRKSEDSG